MPPDTTGKSTIRAQRIHHHHRMRARTWSIARLGLFPQRALGSPIQWRDRGGRLRRFRTWADVNEFLAEEVRHRAENRSIRAGICCGGLRRWIDERTRQERLAAISAREQLEEIPDSRGHPDRI